MVKWSSSRQVGRWAEGRRLEIVDPSVGGESVIRFAKPSVRVNQGIGRWGRSVCWVLEQWKILQADGKLSTREKKRSIFGMKW